MLITFQKILGFFETSLRTIDQLEMEFGIYDLPETNEHEHLRHLWQNSLLHHKPNLPSTSTSL